MDHDDDNSVNISAGADKMSAETFDSVSGGGDGALGSGIASGMYFDGMFLVIFCDLLSQATTRLD
jgi:hypothetical protein